MNPTFDAHRRIGMVVLCMIVGLGGCSPSKTKVATDFDTTRRALVAWLTCEECTDGELDAVVAFGPRVVASLASTLREGPSPASVAELRAHLETNYDKLVAYQVDHPEAAITMTKAEYVNAYLGNQAALYRSRAAMALGAIGGDEARSALSQALSSNLREDVRATVEKELRR